MRADIQAFLGEVVLGFVVIMFIIFVVSMFNEPRPIQRVVTKDIMSEKVREKTVLNPSYVNY